MDKGAISKRLSDLLTRDTALCIAINGKWGVGKTYFWTKFAESNFKKTRETYLSLYWKEISKKYENKPSSIFAVKDTILNVRRQQIKDENTKAAVYISLFGKETLQQIRNDLLLQIYSQNSWIKRIKDRVGNLNLYGLYVTATLSFFEKKDFNDIIVCFDDFERLSEKLDVKDILGLISELKEQKNCHVVMIFNGDKIRKDNSLAIYKDKIIDYELDYDPSPESSFDLVKDDLQVFHTYAQDFFKKHSIKNIRNIKRVINALNDYSFIESSFGEYKDLERDIINMIMGIAYVNASSQVSFEELESYSNRKWHNISNKPIGESSIKSEDDTQLRLEELLKYLNNYRFNILPKERNVILAVKSSIVGRDEFNALITEDIDRKNKSDMQNKLQEFVLRSRNDLQYSFDNYAKDIFLLLKQNSNSLVEILSSDSFLFYIEELIKFDNKSAQKYKDFAINVLKEYLDKLTSIKSMFSFDIQRVDKIKKFDSELEEYYFKLKSLDEKGIIDKKDGVLNLMLKPIVKEGWDSEDCILLSKVKVSDLKEYLLNDYNFMLSSRNFIDWLNGFKNPIGFEEYRDNLIEAMIELQEDGNEEQKVKLDEILNQFTNIKRV